VLRGRAGHAAGLDEIVNNTVARLAHRRAGQAAQAGSAAQDAWSRSKTRGPRTPQAKKSLALVYAVNPFGADHQSSEHDWMYEQEMASPLYLSRLAELGLKDPPAPGSFGAEKVRFAAKTQIFYSILDTLELCQFVWGPAWCLYGPMEMVELVRRITGWPEFWMSCEGRQQRISLCGL
jgi:aldehyde:ferredoxin oxidoreductase